MNPEIYIILSAVFGAGLFALGGTDIKIGGRGYKWIKRELLPLIWAGLALMAGFEWWRCLGMAIAYDACFRLPYGDRTPKYLKFIVFMAYPLPSLFLGFNIWQLYVGGLCFGFWALSNWKPTARMFEWVIACLLMGFFLGTCIGQLIAQTY